MVAASSELIREIDAIERARDHGVISDMQRDADVERLLRRCGALR